MRLYLLQHGDALPSDTDPTRPLSARGQGDIAALAGFVANTAFRPARILHSGKLRAQQTAEKIAAEACSGVCPAAASGLKPGDPVTIFGERIKGWHEDTLIVGHMPFLGRLLAHLIQGDPESEIVSFEPGSIACLETAPGERWRLVWMLRPELLRGPD